MAEGEFADPIEAWLAAESAAGHSRTFVVASVRPIALHAAVATGTSAEDADAAQYPCSAAACTSTTRRRP